MSDPAASAPTPVPAPAHDPKDRNPHSLVIRVWPNVPILYPMAIAALLCGIFSMLFGVDKELSRLSTKPQVTQTDAAQSGTSMKNTDGNWTVLDGKKVLVTADPEKIAADINTEQVIALIFLAAFTYTLIVVCTDIVLTWAHNGAGADLGDATFDILSNLFHLNCVNKFISCH